MSIELIFNRIRATTGWLVILFTLLSFPASAAVDVAAWATSGTGFQSSPWTGWDTSINWQGDTEYFFKGGHYAYSISPNFLKTGIALRGEAGTVLHYNGTGNAIVFDNSDTLGAPTNWTAYVRMENFIIQGTSAGNNGLFLRGVRNGYFKHISVRDVPNAGVWTEALVTNLFENVHVAITPGFSVRPRYGIVLASRGGDWTTTSTFINPVIEGTTNIGIWVQSGPYGNTFINGTVEMNLGKGMVLDGPQNTIISTDFEANGDGMDLEINSASNELQGVYSSHLINVKAGQMNKLRGRFHDVRIANICDFTDMSGANLSGTLTDESLTTIKMGYQTGQGLMNQSFVGNVVDVMLELGVPGNGTIATDARRSKLFSFVMYADTMLSNPTNGVNGQLVTWRIQQDGQGGHILSYGSMFESLTGLLPVLNPAPFSFTEISARFNSSANKWQTNAVISRVIGVNR